MPGLADKTCTACEGKEDELSQEEVENLLDEVPGWELDDRGRLVREYEFEDFVDAMGFVQEAALVAEAEFHHPNIYIHSWNQVKIDIYTHEIDGLTESDFILAAKLNQLHT